MSQEHQHRIHLDQMYQEIIRDHTKDPRNYGSLDGPGVISREGYNPLCGDRVTVQVKLNDRKDKIEASSFKGEGCSICMASSSIMAQEIEALEVDKTKELIETLRAVMQNQKEPAVLEGDLEALSGVRKFPVRIKCALLPWTTLKTALKESEQ